MSLIQLVLVDDHRLNAEGCESLLTNMPNIQLVERFSDLSDLLLRLKHISFHVILVNLYHPVESDHSIMKIISRKYPKIKLLVHTFSNDRELIRLLLMSGVKGILTKNSDKTQLYDALFSLRSGYNYFSQEIPAAILKKYSDTSLNEEKSDHEEIINLTTREIEILKLFSEGYSNQMMAARLFISVRTVEAHKNNIMQKLSIKSSVDLVKYAIRNNLTEV